MVKLGRQGENLTQEVQIDVSAWTEDNMEGATFLIAAVRPGETESYLPEITQSREHPDMEAHGGGHRQRRIRQGGGTSRQGRADSQKPGIPHAHRGRH